MDNERIAEVFERIAALLEIEDSNPFRIMAWRNAAWTIRDLARPIADMVEQGEDLRALPQVGKDTAAAMVQLVKEGRSDYLESLASRVPVTLLDVMRLPGLGPKKARRLWQELGVTDLDSLERAAREGRIAGLKGFGKKTEESILRRIERARGNA